VNVNSARRVIFALHTISSSSFGKQDCIANEAISALTALSEHPSVKADEVLSLRVTLALQYISDKLSTDPHNHPLLTLHSSSSGRRHC